MATQLLYQMIIEKTPADKDQDHINLMILNHATMPDRTAAINAGGEEAKRTRRLLLEDCMSLQLAGCKGLCVGCNTAHYFIHDFEDELGIPVISIIRTAAKGMASRFPGGKIAILATTGTLKVGLYQEALSKQGLLPYEPSEAVQQAVMHIIYDCVKAGKPADKESLALIDAELKSSGCCAALLACTELSVVKKDGDFGEAYYDAMVFLADAVVDFMKGSHLEG